MKKTFVKICTFDNLNHQLLYMYFDICSWRNIGQWDKTSTVMNGCVSTNLLNGIYMILSWKTDIWRRKLQKYEITKICTLSSTMHVKYYTSIIFQMNCSEKNRRQYLLQYTVLDVIISAKSCFNTHVLFV